MSVSNGKVTLGILFGRFSGFRQFLQLNTKDIHSIHQENTYSISFETNCI